MANTTLHFSLLSSTRFKARFQLVFTSEGVGVDCRRDIARLRYRGGGRRGLERPRPLSSFDSCNMAARSISTILRKNRGL